MQILVNGLISGVALALLSVAFSLVYLPARVFYIALAGIYTIVPFIALMCMQIALPWQAAIVGALMAGTLLSVCCESFNHSLLDAKRASSGAHMISSLGIYIIIAQLTAIVWGNESKVLRTGLDKVDTIGDLIVTQSQEISMLVGSVLLLAYFLWLWRSKAGLFFRAMADNSDEFALRGHSLRKMRLVSFALSGFFCSASSLLVAYDIGFDAHGGLSTVLLAVVAVMIGGRQSFAGPVVGALCLGIIRALVVWSFSAQWAEAFTFASLALMLLVRPQGLLGSKLRVSATT